MSTTVTDLPAAPLPAELLAARDEAVTASAKTLVRRDGRVVPAIGRHDPGQWGSAPLTS